MTTSTTALRGDGMTRQWDGVNPDEPTYAAEPCGRLAQPDTLDVDRLARAIDRHAHAIGWDRMCESAWCAAAIAAAYEEDEG